MASDRVVSLVWLWFRSSCLGCHATRVTILSQELFGGLDLLASGGGGFRSVGERGMSAFALPFAVDCGKRSLVGGGPRGGDLRAGRRSASPACRNGRARSSIPDASRWSTRSRRRPSWRRRSAHECRGAPWPTRSRSTPPRPTSPAPTSRCHAVDSWQPLERPNAGPAVQSRGDPRHNRNGLDAAFQDSVPEREANVNAPQ